MESNVRPSVRSSFTDPLIRELNALHSAELDLGRHYDRLRRAKNPSRALRLRFVAELVKLQARMETLDRVLRASESLRVAL